MTANFSISWVSQCRGQTDGGSGKEEISVTGVQTEYRVYGPEEHRVRLCGVVRGLLGRGYGCGDRWRRSRRGHLIRSVFHLHHQSNHQVDGATSWWQAPLLIPVRRRSSTERSRCRGPPRSWYWSPTVTAGSTSTYRPPRLVATVPRSRRHRPGRLLT